MQRNLFAGLVSVTLLAVVTAALWCGTGYFVQLAITRGWLSDPLIVSLALLVAGFGVARSIRSAKRRDGEYQLREKRRQVYEELALYWQRSLRADSDQSVSINSALAHDLASLELLFTMQAAPAVLRPYELFCQSTQPGQSSQSVFESFHALVVEMRKDLGIRSACDEPEAIRKLLLSSLGMQMEKIESRSPLDRLQHSPLTSLRPVISLARQ